MGKKNKIVVEVEIDAPLPIIWDRSQEPTQHLLWDIRFSEIAYLETYDDKGRQALRYRTKIGFGIAVEGRGYYAHSKHHEQSVFLFDSNDWKSLITNGRGLWLYRDKGSHTFFKTVFDYEIRFGIFGRIIDRLFFRPLFQLTTEWGFETLRLWCEGDVQACQRRRPKRKFLWFFIQRMMGIKKAKARSWLGTGKTKEAQSKQSDCADAIV